MVSLENKYNYVSRISETPKLQVFSNFLRGEETVLPENTNTAQADEVYYGVIKGVLENDKNIFETFYNKKNKSNPTKDSPSPFVNDDFLIFCLIVGIMKFQLDRSWILKIVPLRAKNDVTTTFQNILNEDFQSINNQPAILLVFFNLYNLSLITPSLVNSAYKRCAENNQLFDSKSDFLILCSLCAYDLCIELKTTLEGGEMDLLKTFNARFLKRVNILTWLVQIAVLAVGLYIVVLLVSTIPTVEKFFNDYDPVLGVFGISLFGTFIPSLRKLFYQWLLRLLGYPAALINKENKKES